MVKKPTIMVVVPSLRRGGVERVVSLVSREWAQEHKVIVALFNAKDKAYGLDDSIRTFDLDCPASASGFRKTRNALVRIARLAALIRRESPDRVFTFMESANFPAIFACLLTNRLRDLTISVRNNPSTFPPYYRVLIPLLYRWSGRIVAVSDGVRRALVRDFRLPERRCTAIPNPVDFELIDEERTRTPTSEIPSGPFVLAVGRLVRQKGFDMLLAAFHRSRASADHTLVILGDGPERNTLGELTRTLGMQDKVLMPGTVPSPAPFMSRARCMVLSSRFEGWPNVIGEAMACECPVIAFDCAFGPSEIIQDGQSGILVPAGDVDALAARIDDVLADNHLRSEIGRKGRERARAFGVATISRRWLAQV